MAQINHKEIIDTMVEGMKLAPDTRLYLDGAFWDWMRAEKRKDPKGYLTWTAEKREGLKDVLNTSMDEGIIELFGLTNFDQFEHPMLRKGIRDSVFGYNGSIVFNEGIFGATNVDTNVFGQRLGPHSQTHFQTDYSAHLTEGYASMKPDELKREAERYAGFAQGLGHNYVQADKLDTSAKLVESLADIAKYQFEHRN